jgi:drug/metabolite transporter (DMT)-like permease
LLQGPALPLSNTSKSDLLLLVVTFMAAISWMFSREAVAMMPPVMFIAVRFFLGGVLLGAFATAQVRRLTAPQVWRCVRVGLVFGMAMSCWISGLHRIDHVGEGAFLTSLAVVVVPVIARLGFGEAQPATTWVALPVAVAGLALLSLENGFRPEPAQLFFITAAVLFALYFNLNTHAANARTVTDVDGVERSEQIPVTALTAVVLITVGLFGATVSLITEPWTPTLGNLSLELAGWVLASTLVGTSGRFLVQTYAQSLSAHSHGVVILVLEPVWVALIAAGWFGETMGGSQLGGCAMIFAALLINRAGALRRMVKGWLRA